MANIQLIKQLREMTGAGMMDAKKALTETNDDVEKAVEWLRKNGIAKASKKAGRVAAEGIVAIFNDDKKIGIIEVNSETDFVASNDKFIEAVNKVLKASVEADIKTQEELLNLEVEGVKVSDLITDLIATIGEKISIRRFLSFDLANVSAGSYTHSNKRIGTIVISNNKNEDPEVLRDVAMHIAAMNPKFASQEEISEDYIENERTILTEQYKEQFADKPANILNNIVEGALKKQLAETVLLEQNFVKDPSKKIKDLFKGSQVRFIRYEVGEGIEKQEVDFAKEVMAQVNKK